MPNTAATDLPKEIRAAYKAVADALAASGTKVEVDVDGLTVTVDKRKVSLHAYVHTTTREVSYAIVQNGETRWFVDPERVALGLLYGEIDGLVECTYHFAVWRQARRAARGRTTPKSRSEALKILMWLDNGGTFPEGITPQVLGALRYDAAQVMP